MTVFCLVSHWKASSDHTPPQGASRERTLIARRMDRGNNKRVNRALRRGLGILFPKEGEHPGIPLLRHCVLHMISIYDS
jgi:hypothetical protein